jgi:hypothetical protein
MNDQIIVLPMSAAQVSGLSWSNIKLVRTGAYLYVYLDGVLVNTARLNGIVELGGKFTVGRGVADKVHDIRVVNEAVSSTATDYYLDNLSQNNGNSTMPVFGNVDAAATSARPNFTKPSNWNSGADSDADGSTIYVRGGALAITVTKIAGVPTLTITDPINGSLAVPLAGMTAEQIAGTDWSNIRIERIGTSLSIYLDNTLLETTSIVKVNYGGKAHICRACVNGTKMHDIRIVSTNISSGAAEYYLRALAENNGKALLP